MNLSCENPSLAEAEFPSIVADFTYIIIREVLEIISMNTTSSLVGLATC